ncbi:MAG: EAL domain-containing protein [Candidatus Dormibacteraeota bacterium]|nr:EAL domain-containing protein [Candidatus Dormibacteraeota bacterium]MBV9526141.1 EAL domain-containing protein [Candidatus Dormibacteraeota bacterium]
MTALKARAARWRLTPVQRLWTASLGLLLAACGLWFGVVRLLPVYATPQLPWWTLVPLFFAADRWPLTLNVRRGAPALGMAAAPLIIGLFFLTPTDVLLAYAGGIALSSLLRRPRAAAQALFAIAQFVVLSALSEIVFHAFRMPSDGFAWQAWVAAGLAVSVLVAGNTTALVFLDQQGSSRLRWRELYHKVGYAVGGAAASACFGLIAVEFIHFTVSGLVVVAVLAAILLTGYRVYVAEHQERLALEFLHGAGDALGSRELESAIVQLLNRARAMFSAEIAQLTIFPSATGEKAFRTTVYPTRPAQVMEPLDLGQLDDVLEAERDGVIVDRHNSPPATVDMLARRGINEAMVAVLRGENRLLGALLVGGHLDSRSFDARDLQLFQTLAIQTCTTLENGRLERSIARLSELQEQLTHQAFHDSLTGLANRTLFGDRIEHALQRAARVGRSVAVLFIDVDDFKGVNDTLGHAAGDALLVGVADRLRRSLRRPDTAARLGGDEFAVVLEDVHNVQEAEMVAKRIFDNLRTPFEANGQAVKVRVSIGVAFSDAAEDNASALMRHADVAMYAAKGAGKDRHVVFTPGMDSDIVSRHRLRSDLEAALAADQFVVHYQPVVDLTCGDIVALEALVRWRHPHRGLVPPSEFIPLAEESGLILPLGDFVLRTACHTLLRLQARFPRAEPLAVTVNISARQLEHHLFVESVFNAVKESGIVPESLVLELTESILLEDSSQTTKLEALRRAGIRIAIDDFGTGYSSLSYLRNLPIDTLKIAKPFVDDLGTGGGSGDFAHAIVGLGRALHLSLIAEGIELPEQVALLRNLGCTLGQGFYLSHPVADEEIEFLLRQGGVDLERVDADSTLLDQVIPLPIPG